MCKRGLVASRPRQPGGQLSLCRVHPGAVLLLFPCLSMEAEVWVVSFNLSYCSAPRRGQADLWLILYSGFAS